MHVVDFRRRDDVDVVLLDDLSEVLRYGIFDRLCTGRFLAFATEVGFDDASRSLAGTESGDSHLSRQLAIGHLDVLFE
ncbi:MAG: hypothetical protein RIR54_969 [Actinomycetota bacterium]